MTTTALAVIEEDVLGKRLVDGLPEWTRMLGSEKDAERFIQEAWAAIIANPKLRECTPASLFGALYFGAQLGLPIGGPMAQFHLTIRKGAVVPVVGYGGYITLAMNTGEYDAIEGKLVYANDEFTPPYDDETGTHFRLTPARGARGALIGVIGRALVKGADRSIVEYIDIETVRAVHRPDYWESTPWKMHEADMVKKTGVRRVSKYTSKSRESWRFALAAQGDQAVATVNEAGELEFEHETGPTEDWAALINDPKLDDKADLAVLADRIRGIENGERVRDSEMTSDLRALVLARAGTLSKDSRPQAEQPSEAEREALALGRDEAAVAEQARAAMQEVAK